MNRRVTVHALVRWLERVRGLDAAITAVVDKDAADPVRAAAGLRILGVTWAQACEQILPPRLHAGIASGATAVIGPGYRLVLDGGRVVTVLGRDMSPGRRRTQTRRRPATWKMEEAA